MGNMMLAAHSLGLGGIWIHRAKEEFDSLQGKELLKVWNLSENYVGVGHVVLGYPEDDYKPTEKHIKEDYVVYLDELI